MKKLLFTAFVIMFMAGYGFCGSSVRKWNRNVPQVPKGTPVFKIDSSNNLSLNYGLVANSATIIDSSGNLGAENLASDFVNKVDSYTITSSDLGKVLTMTKTTNASFTLPISTSVTSGKILWIKNKVTDGQTLTIARNGGASDTIDGVGSDLTTTSINDSYLLINDSANNDWKVLSITVR